ncbi:hypothetical protein MKX07_000553 [Trichoderma sp. CBMAI-0711]|nr:hypothetical protein MKX07_000553 [Trichoderma sp. CBMAI-0711]
MRANLDRPVSLARHLKPDPLTALVERNLTLGGHHDARLRRSLVLLGRREGEQVSVRDGQEAAVESAGQVAVVGADGIVDGDEVGASGKGALDLDLGQGRADRGLDVAAAEHGRAEVHEVCDGVIAIADELLEVVCDEGLLGGWVRGES